MTNQSASVFFFFLLSFLLGPGVFVNMNVCGFFFEESNMLKCFKHSGLLHGQQYNNLAICDV
jgi:hypothetical protein